MGRVSEEKRRRKKIKKEKVSVREKVGKSRNTAAFLMLSSSKTEEVSQSSFVFTLADRQIDRQRERDR